MSDREQTERDVDQGLREVDTAFLCDSLERTADRLDYSHEGVSTADILREAARRLRDRGGDVDEKLDYLHHAARSAAREFPNSYSGGKVERCAASVARRLRAASTDAPEERVDDPCENHPGRQAIGHTIDGVGLCRECAPSLEVEVYGALFDQEHVELSEREVRRLGVSICDRLRNAPAYNPADAAPVRGEEREDDALDAAVRELEQVLAYDDLRPSTREPIHRALSYLSDVRGDLMLAESAREGEGEHDREAIKRGAAALVAGAYRLEREQPYDENAGQGDWEAAARLHRMIGNEGAAEACEERARDAKAHQEGSDGD